VEHYVLSPFTKEESTEVDGVIERAVDALADVVALGVEKAMNKHNGTGDRRAAQR
jgi:peptidyl-tRNA hydrolase